MIVLAYLAAIVLANVTTALFGPSWSIVNAFLLIAFDLTARDALHDRWQHDRLLLRMSTLIVAGGLLSYVINADAGRIAVASTLAFAAAAAVDAVVYQLARRLPWLQRANLSNVAGATVDSIVFPTVAFGGLLPLVTLGQLAAKVIGGAAWSLLLQRVRRRATA